MLGWGEREEFADPSILGEGTNWQNEIFRSALMHNHQVSLSGGSESTTFAISGGYLTQEGIGLGSSFDRFSLRMNIDTKVTNWLKMGTNAYIARTKQVNTIDNGDIIRTAISQLPEVPARNPDGSWGSQQENMYGTYFTNPVAEALMRENYNNGTQLNLNAFADVTFIDGLTLRIEGNTSFNYGTNYYFRPSYNFGHYNQQTEGSRSANNGSYMTLRTYLTYSKNFGVQHFSLMAGHEAQEGQWENLSGSRSNYLFNSVSELDAGDVLTARNGSNRGSNALESFFGRLNYSFDDRYLLTATLRNDASSNFGRNNRRATFPSAAIAWKINNESFLKDIYAINNLKLRLGWGLVGNQSGGSYAYGVSMASSPTVWGPGFYPNNFPNPDLQWEKTNSYNIGLDLNLFKNRIELIVDAYRKNIDNLLMQATLPDYIGGLIAAPWVNVGEMTNQGMDFTLNTVNIDNQDGLFWRTGLTASFNRNNVTKLYTEEATILGRQNSETVTLTKVGEPIGQYYGYKVIGMFNQESDFYKADGTTTPIPDIRIHPDGVWLGDFIYQDNGDGLIDEEDRYFIGNPEPKFIFGVNNYFSYKGFDLNIFLNGVYGNSLFNRLRQDFTTPMRNSGMLKETTGIARLDLIDPNGAHDDVANVRVINPDAKIQRITTADANMNSRFSDRFIEDGSFLRIKNIALGYNFPKTQLAGWQIENLRVYVNIQNLYTFTKYKGYDPEVGQSSVIMRGIDNARYPSQRIYTFGLNITL